MNSNFVDHVRIYCRSGAGGPGSVHFIRSRLTAKGGPDGGDGGRGGHIIIKGNSQLWTLLHLRYQKHVIADNGMPGGHSRSFGANGQDIILEVPIGTIAKNEAGEALFEISEHDQEYILLPGGRGGLGNDHFKSPTNQTPRYAQPGESGDEALRILELKLLADVGLVGFPNAGKSTLLSVVSAAKPEIASYPFTTLVPNLGMVSYRGSYSFVMADIPGIIEGAHKGKGIGHRFLRHIERNSTLLFLIPGDEAEPRAVYNTLRRELELYEPALLDKAHVVSVSKSDLLDDELRSYFSEELSGLGTVNFFSAVTGEGIQTLKDQLWMTLNNA